MITHSKNIVRTQWGRKLCRGFSLAEVTIALAIAAGGFVSLLGMIPQGLEMSRKSSNMAAKTRMIDIVTGQIASMPWQNLDWSGHGNGTTTGYRKYFDDQSIELTQVQVNAGAMLSYVVSVYLPPNTGTTSVKLPAATAAAATDEKYTKRAQIYIAETTDPAFVFPVPGPEKLPKNVTFQTLILPEMAPPQL